MPSTYQHLIILGIGVQKFWIERDVIPQHIWVCVEVNIGNSWIQVYNFSDTRTDYPIVVLTYSSGLNNIHTGTHKVTLITKTLLEL